MAAADIDVAIRSNIDRIPSGIDDKIVRQVVRSVPRHIARELDHKALREFKKRALHFQLDTRRPELLRPTVGSGAAGRRPSLMDTVREKLWSRPLPTDIDRQTLVDLGIRYLSEAEARESTSAMAAASATEDDA